MDGVKKVRRKDVLGSICDQKDKDAFASKLVLIHVYALAILISTFHYSKNVSTID